MAKTATIHVRMDEQVKDEALVVFDTLGMTAAEAITLYFRQVAINQGLPFELSTKPRQTAAVGIERVSAFKRKQLDNLLRSLPDSVDQVWVFGSAVTPYCRPDSDLDICLVGESISHEEQKRLFATPGGPIDLLTATHEELRVQAADAGSVYYDIVHKGVLVHQKGGAV